MSIPGVTAVPRIAIAVADTPTATNPVRQIGASPEVEIDAVTQQPKPLRFPWISRLSLQLETAARQKSAFAPAPILGDHLDRSV